MHTPFFNFYIKTMSRWNTIASWKKVLFSVVSGVLLGLILGKQVLYLKPIGIVFINSIKMMIVPVIFTAIVCAIASMNDSTKMRRISIKALSWYAFSMSVAAIIGLTVATVIAPGKGLILPDNATQFRVQEVLGFSDIVVSAIPTNILTALSAANILQILIVSIFIGFSINLAGEAALPVKKLFQGLSAVVFKFSSIVMSFAPFGIFALMATTAGEYGINAIIPLFKLILSGYL